MVDGTSRYDGAEIATTAVPDGAGGERLVRYLRRRPQPDPAAVRPLAVHRVVQGDRIDLLTGQYLGDPTAFWRIAEANAALDPYELVSPKAEGTVIIIPIPLPGA